MISPRRLSPASLFGLVTLASILLLACALVFAPPDGAERSQLMQFFGRLHLLAIHLPIALLIFVPLLELAGRTRRFSYLLPASGFVLGTALLGAIAAAILGWCLARSGAYSGRLVTQHMWAGMVVAIGAWLCWYLRSRSDGANHSAIYVVTLAATVLTVSFTGYRGGQLSQGETHLTEYMPAPLAALLQISNPTDLPSNSAIGGPATYYGSRIHPIFAQHCIGCHGRNKHRGDLRLDRFEGLMRGGKHGPVVKTGDAKGSELLRRIALSPGDNDFMPAENQPLSQEEKKILEQWIAGGASGTVPRDAIQRSDAASSTSAVTEVTFKDVDPGEVSRLRSGRAAAVVQFQQQFPNVLGYESRNSSDLTVSASWMQSKFGDSSVALLAPLADQIVSADFSSTAITDKSAATIAAMKHLRVLRLVHTRISDASLPSLATLNELESLSLFDTQITSKGLPAFARQPKLQHIYVGNTRVVSGRVVPKDIASKLIF